MAAHKAEVAQLRKTSEEQEKHSIELAKCYGAEVRRVGELEDEVTTETPIIVIFVKHVNITTITNTIIIT